MAEEGKNEGRSFDMKNLMMYFGTMVMMTAVAFFLVTKFLPQPASNVAAQGEQQTQQVKQNDQKPKVKPVLSDDTFLYQFGDVIVNPAGTEGTRFLRVTIYLELASAEYQKMIEKFKPALQDIAIQILSSKTIPELEDLDSRNKLRKEIVSAMNQVLGGEVILKLFFTEFVIQ